MGARLWPQVLGDVGARLMNAEKHKSESLHKTRKMPSQFVPLTQDGSDRLPSYVWQHALDFLPVPDKCVMRGTCKFFQSLITVDPKCIDHAKLRVREDRHPQGPYMQARQPNLNPRIRMILLDWIGDLHHAVNYCPATLYRTAQILDKCLTVMEKMTSEKLQLLGVTAFMIASREFEDNVMTPAICVHVTGNSELPHPSNAHTLFLT